MQSREARAIDRTFILFDSTGFWGSIDNGRVWSVQLLELTCDQASGAKNVSSSLVFGPRARFAPW